MSYRKLRKRRRAETSQEPEDVRKNESNAAHPDHNGSQKHQHEEGQPIEEDIGRTAESNDDGGLEDGVKEIPQKELEIWDAFREENYEVLEQLPLSLHRSFTLMLELDQQVHKHEGQLLPALQRYIALRKTLAEESRSSNSPQADHEGNAEGSNIAAVEYLDAMQVDDRPALSKDIVPKPQSSNGRASVVSSSKRSSSANASQNAESSRDLLIQVAQLSEDVVRASNEKVNVARFAYDLVDRYIRDLDRSIKEQETSISLGLRPGTHPASIILPEVVPPSGIRGSRNHESLEMEMPATQEAAAIATEAGETNLGMIPQEALPAGQEDVSVRPRRRNRSKWSRKKKSMVKPSDIAETAEETVASSGLKLTVPALASLTQVIAFGPDDMPVDPNEPRYCYCNQVSYGEMIACDNKDCVREWFHLGCVGLTRPPADKVKWYCRECIELVGPRRKGR